jgi:F-type H+-transporting ATPase subunit b
MLRRTIAALLLLGLTPAIGSPARAAETAKTPQANDTRSHPAPVAKTEGNSVKATEGHPSGEGVASSHGETPNIIEVQPSLGIWTVVVFLGLMAVLGRYAWKPLLRALHERESHLEHVLLDSERARNEAEALAAQNRRELAQAADQVRAELDRARKDAQAIHDSILRKAQEAAEAAREQAKREIESYRDQALLEIRDKTADLAVSVAGRVLSRELGPDDHRRLVALAMTELPANGHPGVRT